MNVYSGPSDASYDCFDFNDNLKMWNSSHIDPQNSNSHNGSTSQPKIIVTRGNKQYEVETYTEQ